MKDQILKIAGVKSEKEFYKKYPTEEAFQKAHGKEFKKAKLGAAMVPKAQGGTTYSLGDEDNRPMGFMFNGRAMRLGDINKIKEKSIKDPKPISAWEDLSDINNYTSDRGEQKALKKEYEGIKDKYKGLTINQYVAAKRDADRTSVQLANNERYGKYFDESGKILPNTDLRLIDPNLRFYKEKFPKQSKISTEDVLGTWNGIEGGFPSYEGYVNEGYKKPLKAPMKEGGQLHKLQQLTDFGNPPVAQDGYISSLGATPNILSGASNGFDWTMGNQQSLTALPNIQNPNPVPSYMNIKQGSVASGGAGTNEEIMNASKNAVKPPSAMKGPGAAQLIGAGFQVAQGIQEAVQQKKQLANTRRDQRLSELSLQAANSSRANQPKRQYYNPADYAQINPNAMGSNTNYLQLQDGGDVGGNPTEIQNTFAPIDLYEGLEYEPLNDSDNVKQYGRGGLMRADAGSTIGGAVGGVAGSFFGPIGTMVGSQLGGLIGGALDKSDEKAAKAAAAAEKNTQNAAFASFQNANKGFMEDGGWMSHDWQPQVISQFDGHPIKSLLTKDPMMDTLRSGGHITQNNMFPQDQYALGGDLKTTWGGYAEPISKNPYDESETVMFRGKSHSESDGNGHTGIGVKYGEGGSDSYTDYAEYGTKDADADVEVQRNEPAKKINGDLVVGGGMQTSKEAAAYAGDKKFAGRKFQTNIANIAKHDAKLNKQKTKIVDAIDSHDDYTPIGILKMNALKAMLTGIDGKQLNNHTASTKLLDYQSNIHEVADQLSELYGKKVDPNSVEKNKIKFEKNSDMAKSGKKIKKAQYGDLDLDYATLEPDESPSNVFNTKDMTPVVVYSKTKKKGLHPSNVDVQKVELPHSSLSDLPESITAPTMPYSSMMGPNIPDWWKSMNATSSSKTNNTKTKGDKKPNWLKRNEDLLIPTLNQAIEQFRPSDAQPFDSSQIYPEMMAASMNQEDPVFMQGVRYDLSSPQTYSLQDQLNEVTAQSRAAERMAGQNPAAAAAIFAGVKDAKNKILGEQFRINQGEQQRVGEQNRQTLKEQQLQNLQLYGTQADRQALAKAKTKQQAIEIAKSVTDKKIKQELENKKLAVMENLYKFRFDKNGRVRNMNPLATFNASVGAGKSASSIPDDWTALFDSEGTFQGTKKKKKDADESRNGSIVKAIKNL